MTEHDVEEMVFSLLNGVSLEDMDADVSSVRTYEDAGFMTYDKGLVLRMRNGDEFRITIVQSEVGSDDDSEDWDDEYIPSSSAGDYGPGNPWDAPGMSVSDFIDCPVYYR